MSVSKRIFNKHELLEIVNIIAEIESGKSLNGIIEMKIYTCDSQEAKLEYDESGELGLIIEEIYHPPYTTYTINTSSGTNLTP